MDVWLVNNVFNKEQIYYKFMAIDCTVGDYVILLSGTKRVHLSVRYWSNRISLWYHFKLFRG